MKKALFLLVAALTSFSAKAANCDLVIRQLDLWGSEVPRLVAVPAGCAGASGVVVYESTTMQPQVYTIDSTLLFASGQLRVGTIAMSNVSGLVAGLAAKYNQPGGTTSQYIRGDGSVFPFPTIPSAYSVGIPNSRTMALATAYQCTDTSKPCTFTITLQCPLNSFLTGGSTCAGEVRVGSANTVASGASGTAVGPINRSVTGVSTLLAFTNGDYETKTIKVPLGWYIAIRQTNSQGGTLTVPAAFDQSEGN